MRKSIIVARPLIPFTVLKLWIESEMINDILPLSRTSPQNPYPFTVLKLLNRIFASCRHVDKSHVPDYRLRFAKGK